MAVWMLVQGAAFLGLPPAETGQVEQLLDHVDAHRRTASGEALGDIRRSQVGPEHLRVHGIAGGVVLQHRLKLANDLRDRF